MIVFWILLALLCWMSQMLGLSFFQWEELLPKWNLPLYLGGLQSLLQLLLLRLGSGPLRRSQVVGTLVFLLFPWGGTVQVLPQGHFGALPGLLCLVLYRRYKRAWLLLPLPFLGWTTAGICGLTLLAWHLSERLPQSRRWNALPPALQLVLLLWVGYHTIGSGEAVLNRRLIVPWQLASHSLPVQFLPPRLDWFVVHLGSLTETGQNDVEVTRWLAAKGGTAAVIPSSLTRIYQGLCPQLSWSSPDSNWGLHHLSHHPQGWAGCGLDWLVMRNAPPEMGKPAFSSGDLAVFSNPQASLPKQSAQIEWKGPLKSGASGQWEVQAPGPVAIETGQLPHLVLGPGITPWVLPAESAPQQLRYGSWQKDFPSLSQRAAWEKSTISAGPLRVPSYSVERIQLEVENLSDVDLSLDDLRGLQISAPWSPKQPLIKVSGALPSGSKLSLEVPWKTPNESAGGRLDFDWILMGGKAVRAGSCQVQTWVRPAPATIELVSPPKRK